MTQIQKKAVSYSNSGATVDNWEHFNYKVGVLVRVSIALMKPHNPKQLDKTGFRSAYSSLSQSFTDRCQSRNSYRA